MSRDQLLSRIIICSLFIVLLFVSCATSKSVDTETVAAPGDRSAEVFTREGEEGKLTVRFIDIVAYENGLRKKTGDCILLVSPEGKTMLIDTSTPTGGPILLRILDEMGITHLDYLVITHTHADHTGGASNVLAHIKVDKILMNFDTSDEFGGTYLGKMLDEAYVHNVPIERICEGYEFNFGEYIKVNVYNPPEGYDYLADPQGVEVRNNSSLLLRMDYGNSSFLFCGDMYAGAESAALKRYPEGFFETDIVKMNHHGYDSSNTLDWVKAVKAKAAIATNTHGPDSAKEIRYRAYGALTFWQYADGTIRVSTSGDGKYEIITQHDRNIATLKMTTNEDGHYYIGD